MTMRHNISCDFRNKTCRPFGKGVEGDSHKTQTKPSLNVPGPALFHGNWTEGEVEEEAEREDGEAEYFLTTDNEGDGEEEEGEVRTRALRIEHDDYVFITNTSDDLFLRRDIDDRTGQAEDFLWRALFIVFCAFI